MGKYPPDFAMLSDTRGLYLVVCNSARDISDRMKQSGVLALHLRLLGRSASLIIAWVGLAVVRHVA